MVLTSSLLLRDRQDSKQGDQDLRPIDAGSVNGAADNFTGAWDGKRAQHLYFHLMVIR